MYVTSHNAKKIVHAVLSTYEEVLGVSLMNMNGNILASNSKEVFREAFKITEDRANYGGALAVATLNVVNETRNVFGRAKAISQSMKIVS
jgi:hypothetical protein